MKGKYRLLAILTVVAVLSGGCFKKPEEQAEDPLPVSPGQVVEVSPVEPPKNQEELPPFASVIAGIAENSLGYPVAAYQDETGDTYVLDLYSTGGLVKVFDARGKFKSKSVPLKSPECQPADFAVDGDGNIYIADIGIGAVQKYRGDELVAEFRPGEDFYPRSIAADSKGNLWVMSFNRVYKITPEGKSEFFGRSGDGEGEFGTASSEFYIGPSGLCLDLRDNIYIADTLNDRVQKFDESGKFIGQIPLSENFSPEGIWVNPSGEIYLVSRESLIKLDASGNILKTIDINGWGDEPADYLNLGGGENETLLVVIPERHRVKVYSGDTEVYSIYGASGEGFIYPKDVGVYKGNIAIVGGDPFYQDELNHRALLFDGGGKLISCLLSDFGVGSFLSPTGVAFLDDRWYVLDLDIISVFGTDGRFITAFGGRGSERGDFGVYDNFGQEEGPENMIPGKDGVLIVSDTHNSRIQKIDKDGKYLGGFGVDRPGAIAEDAEGNIYAVVPHKGKIVKYTPSGDVIFEFGKIGEGDGEFTVLNLEGLTLGPKGIAADPKDGLIYIADSEANRIQVFDEDGKFVKIIGGFAGADQEGFYHPSGLTFDENGFLWVADTGNHRVIRLDIR